MASSIFSTFCSVSALLLLGPLISSSFHQTRGSNWENMAMAIVDEEDSMGLLPFGSAAGIGNFGLLSQCGGPRRSAQGSSPQDFVNAHNAARAEVGVGLVQWDETVASFALQYANQRINDCQLMHSGGPYGENIAWSNPDLSGTDAVQLWVDEKQYYNYVTNICVSAQVCGHYTQVVWRNSLKIGCARVVCNNDRGTFITCNYDPAGNFIGQRPY